MSKAEIKAVCEADDKLQWWAMVLFAEISELFDPAVRGVWDGNEDGLLHRVESKVKEFERIIIGRCVQNAQKQESTPEARP